MKDTGSDGGRGLTVFSDFLSPLSMPDRISLSIILFLPVSLFNNSTLHVSLPEPFFGVFVFPYTGLNKGKNRPNRTHSSQTLGCLKGLAFPPTNPKINKHKQRVQSRLHSESILEINQQRVKGTYLIMALVVRRQKK